MAKGARRVRLGSLLGAALIAAAGAVLDLRAQAPATGTADQKDWIQLFNGRDLSGWTPKFSRHDLGENFNNTFRVENGLLEVRYDQWTKFDGEFGHLFYKDPYSY